MSPPKKRQFPKVEALPPYVFALLQDLKSKAIAQGEDIVDLGMGNPDSATPAPILEVMQRELLKAENHRYSVSRGIAPLRRAIADWYARQYDVTLDSETECIATLGAKEGLAHLVLAVIGPGDRVLVPDPSYPIHSYSVVIAGGTPQRIPMPSPEAFFHGVEQCLKQDGPKPQGLILSFPHNPTTFTVDLPFFQRVIDLARAHGLWVIHDLAYADLCFDGYRAPSILQVPGAKDVAVELYSMSKGYTMPGWRVGFVCGNAELVAALTRIKSYLDYGMFQPVQIAAAAALQSSGAMVHDVVGLYKKRRDMLVEGLHAAGWNVETPHATMFLWAKIPDAFTAMGSLEFCKHLLKNGKTVISPGIGFGPGGEGFVRFALVENEDRLRQALHGIKTVLQNG